MTTRLPGLPFGFVALLAWSALGLVAGPGAGAPLVGLPFAGAATIVVDPSGGGDFVAIQPALDAAADGDVVLVRPGEYVIEEPLDFNRLHDPASPESPPVKDLTLRAEDGPATTTVRRSTATAEPERSSVAVFQSGEGEASAIEGFTLTGGGAPPSPWMDGGSGIHFRAGSRPVVRGCVVRECTGSGLRCESSPTIEDTRIVGNRRFGVSCFEGSPALTRCVIAGNDSSGVDCWGASPHLTDCALEGNAVYGLFASTGSSPRLVRCEVRGNFTCGISLTSDASAHVEDCAVFGNVITGVVCDGGASPTVVSSTIARNGGDGVTLDDGAKPVFRNSTISGNGRSGVYAPAGHSLTLSHCIVWDNVLGSLGGGPFLKLDVAYSCVDNESHPLPGAGNIDADPLFCGWGTLAEAYVDASSPGPGDGSVASPFPALEPALEHSYALAEGSPCLGAGAEGENLGDDRGTCGSAGVSARTVHLASGTYSLRGYSLAHRTSLLGSGRDSTIVRGGVMGLQTGSALSDLTVTRGTNGGITLEPLQSPEVRRVKITGNYGYGVWATDSSALFADCVISGNYSGGALFSSGTPILENCAIYGNASSSNSGGLVAYMSSLIATNCTITANVAEEWGHGGVDCTSGGTGLNACIIWGNQPESICDDPYRHQCLTGVDPLFVSPGVFDPERFAREKVGEGAFDFPDFIVEEPDLNLQEGSPAIDAADCTGGPDHDIDGKSRPSGAGCDIGAYERQKDIPGILFLRGETHGEGRVDLSDAVFSLLFLFSGGAAPWCLEAADANDDGSVDIGDPIYTLNFLFIGGSSIPEPWASCGVDPTPDGLGCEVAAGCW